MKLFSTPAPLQSAVPGKSSFPPDVLKKIQKLAVANRTIIAYSESAKWLPFFEVNRCEGNIASSRDTEKLSKIFETPVIAFSIFDSDILFLSYSDAANGVNYDYAKANFAECEEIDTEVYQTEFPAFLLDFCNSNDLKAIWESNEEVLADDRMKKICRLIQTQIIYDGVHVPEGYQAIDAK